MAGTIQTAGSGVGSEVREVLHPKCSREIARIIDGVLHVECVRKGCKEWVPIPGWLEAEQVRQAVDLILSGKVRPQDVIGLSDPLVQCRAIEGLFVIGPAEIEKAFLGPKGENPLGLESGWCSQLMPPIPWTPDQMRQIVALCQTPEWNTFPILWLALPQVADKPTCLVNQCGWWGMGHDGVRPGKIRQNIFYDNWFIHQAEPWAREPAVSQPIWKISYELPVWSTTHNWEDQQKAAQNSGLTISAVTSTVLLGNLSVIGGRKLWAAGWVRTETLSEAGPLYVYWDVAGLRVDRYWNPFYANPDIGLALEVVSHKNRGVPKWAPLLILLGEFKSDKVRDVMLNGELMSFIEAYLKWVNKF